MTLASGSGLGLYRIGGLLGKGGMGEVYRARDEKLGRDVALKVLPSAFAWDPDRFARFEREARLLASLNHPNIAGIHGLEQSGDTHFLVLELVEGETLAQRLVRPISIDQSLRLGLQIAAALEAAHAKSIIHRDLKPGNIMIAKDGTVKVLDFGLAKASSPSPVDDGLTHSPTLSITGTRAGVILGTAGYMSPEQARGEIAKKESDIWAFGCILFEMLAGGPTWPGKSVTDVIAALVAREPEWGRLPAALPPRVRFVLDRCLDKDPDERYREIADARLEIAGALKDPAPMTVPSTSGASKRRPMLAWLGAAAAGISIVAAGLAGWLLKPETVRPVARFDQALPDALPQNTIAPFPLLAVSKDGTAWAISTGNRLFLRKLGEAEAHPVQGITSQFAFTPTFSPDAGWLAYVDAPGTTLSDLAIKKLPITGGTPQTVVSLKTVNSIAAALGVDVSWDDRNMLTWVQPDGIMQVSANGGQPELVVKAAKGEVLASPQVLPNGKAILFVVTTATGPNRWDAAEIVVQPLGSDRRTVVWRGGHDARYVTSGHIVFAQGTTLFAVPFDLGRLKVTGSQTPLVEGLPRFSNPIASDTAQFAVSDSGSLLYLTGGASQAPATGNSAPPRALAWVDRKGNQTPIRIRPDDYSAARVSPDGNKVALVVGIPIDATSTSDIWVYDFVTENARQLTFSPRLDDAPVWTSDSKRIYFRSFEGGDGTHSGVYWVPAEGGTPTLVAKSDDFQYAMPWSLSPDDRTLALLSAHNAADIDLATLDLRGQDQFRLLLKGNPTAIEPAISPNGQWLAYEEVKAATGEINIRPFPEVARQRYPVGSGTHPVFSRDGSELFFFDGQGLSVARVTYQPSLRIGAVQQLFRGQYWYGVTGSSGRLGRAWDADRKGERFLMILLPGAAPAATDDKPPPPIRLNVVLNWSEELKRRVSTH
jgi:serine/threonine-protein kinase